MIGNYRASWEQSVTNLNLYVIPVESVLGTVY